MRGEIDFHCLSPNLVPGNVLVLYRTIPNRTALPELLLAATVTDALGPELPGISR
jgi:hypothetical protein